MKNYLMYVNCDNGLHTPKPIRFTNHYAWSHCTTITRAFHRLAALFPPLHVFPSAIADKTGGCVNDRDDAITFLLNESELTKWWRKLCFASCERRGSKKGSEVWSECGRSIHSIVAPSFYAKYHLLFSLPNDVKSLPKQSAGFFARRLCSLFMAMWHWLVLAGTEGNMTRSANWLWGRYWINLFLRWTLYLKC